MPPEDTIEESPQERELEEEDEKELYRPNEKVICWGMHELILAIVVILNFLGMFHLLPNEIDFIEKFISWTLLGLLLYNARLSEIFFGEEHKKIDTILILSYFGLIAKDLVELSLSMIEESKESMFLDAYRYIIDNAMLFTTYSFIAASIVILVLAIYVSTKVNFKAPSMMHILHEEGLDKTPRKLIERFVLVTLVFFGFFIIVFNLISEWLAIAVDDPLLLLAILLYLFKGRKIAKRLSLSEKIEKFGSLGERFYTHFIEMFKSARTIWFALSGILVLHILTDVANFLIPYLTGLSSALYGKLGANHETIPSLLMQGLSSHPELIDQVALSSGYVLNSLAIILLMIGPGFIWYKLFKKESFDIHPIVIFLFVASTIYFIISPAFSIHTLDLERQNVYGTDIQTHEIEPEPGLLLLSLLAGLVISLFSLIDFIKKMIVLIFTAGIEIFFTYFIALYSYSISIYYITTLKGFIASGQWFLVSILGLFFLINSFYYVISWGTYIYETWFSKESLDD